jgi:hypothetical protein
MSRIDEIRKQQAQHSALFDSHDSYKIVQRSEIREMLNSIDYLLSQLKDGGAGHTRQLTSLDLTCQKAIKILSRYFPVVEQEDWQEKYESLRSKVAWHRDGKGPDIPVLQPRYDALRAEVSRLKSEVERLRFDLHQAEGWIADVEEREAAVCPEDIGFDEYIRTLQKQLATARADAIGECARLLASGSGGVGGDWTVDEAVAALEQLKGEGSGEVSK